MADEPTTREIFESAVNIIKNLPKDGPIKPSNEMKLRFYALFKQATHGSNDTSKPKFYQVVEGYKWDAWRKLGDMPKEEAMLKYIGELKQSMNSLDLGNIEPNPEEEEKIIAVLGKRMYNYWFNHWKKSDINGTSDQVAAETESTYEDAQSDVEFDLNDANNENTLRQTLIRETTMAVIRLHSSLIALRKLPRTVSKT